MQKTGLNAAIICDFAKEYKKYWFQSLSQDYGFFEHSFLVPALNFVGLGGLLAALLFLFKVVCRNIGGAQFWQRLPPIYVSSK